MSHADRSSTPQRPPASDADQDLRDDLDDPDLEADADTGPDVRTPETEDERQGEAGNTYVGREMDDRLKSNPRPENEDDVTEDD